MGLDTSHGCWHGAYSAFMRWRQELAKVVGYPPLELMEGFWDTEKAVLGNPFWLQYESDKKQNYTGDYSIWRRLPIRWDCLKPSALQILLHHSDCEGEIRWQDCRDIALALEKLIPSLPQTPDNGHIGDWKEKTRTFIKGLRLAAKNKENVLFH